MALLNVNNYCLSFFHSSSLCLNRLYLKVKVLIFQLLRSKVTILRCCNIHKTKMSFTKASFKVHSIFQHYVTTPYLVDKNKNGLIENPKYLRKSKEKLVFCLAITVMVLLQPVYFIHLGYLFFTWRSNHKNLKLNQLTFSAIYIAIAAILNASNFMIVTQRNVMKTYVSELCRLVSGINTTSHLKIGKQKLKEAFVYSLYVSVLTMSFAFGFSPFVIDWEPIQLVLGASSGIKIFSACVYGFEGIYSVTLLVSTFTLLFAVLENIEIYAGKPFRYQNGFFTFSLRCKEFRMFQLIVAYANSTLSDFCTMLIAVGVLAASVSTFVTLTLWDSLRIVVYVVSPALSFCCYMIAILMT